MTSRSKIEPILDFDEIWFKCLTKPFEFFKFMQHSEIQKLECLRALSALRTSALEQRSTRHELPSQLEKLEEYIFHLNDLKEKSEIYWTKKTERQLNFYWTSPLVARMDYMKLCGIGVEIVMALFLCACALREEVHWQIKQSVEEGKESSWIIEPVKQLKKAAGIFRHIHIDLSEQITTDVADLTNAPGEIVPAMSECMEKVCLGEAQSLVAYRAHENGKSVSVISALHVGASDLFEEASLKLRKNTGQFNYMSDKFRRFLALSSSLEQIRAYQQTAIIQRNEGEAGMAVGLCQKALFLLDTCAIVAEDDEGWTNVINQEKSYTEEQKDTFDQDRLNVFYQQIPLYLHSLTDGKILVESTEYRPIQKQSFL